MNEKQHGPCAVITLGTVLVVHWSIVFPEQMAFIDLDKACLGHYESYIYLVTRESRLWLWRCQVVDNCKMMQIAGRHRSVDVRGRAAEPRRSFNLFSSGSFWQRTTRLQVCLDTVNIDY